ncbi:PepSY domain-containing protein [Micromonospora sp. NPDC047548]|uniref:PepSY domain-containing protein n=1 Tax=Micromonospora sp. NPDC047548 TaxID=3155624 RepID=UPI0033E26299
MTTHGSGGAVRPCPGPVQTLGVTAPDREVRAPSANLAAAAVDDTPSADDSAFAAPARPDSRRVARDRAGAVALAAVGRGRVVDVEAEQEHGRPVWSVAIAAGATGWDVHVDQVTGAVLRIRQKAGEDRTAPDRRRGDDRPGDDHGGGRHGDDD